MIKCTLFGRGHLTFTAVYLHPPISIVPLLFLCLNCRVLYVKSLSIPNAIRVESEINQMIYLVSDNDILFEIFLLTSSKVGSGWTG